jgi:hypothetical protein
MQLIKKTVVSSSLVITRIIQSLHYRLDAFTIVNYSAVTIGLDAFIEKNRYDLWVLRHKIGGANNAIHIRINTTKHEIKLIMNNYYFLDIKKH